MKREILKEEVDQLINQAFWGKGGIKLTENTEQVTETETQEEVVQDDAEQLEEAAHVCPLCESELSEDISDDKLAEHINLMVEIISEMSDVTDEDLEALAEDVESDEDEAKEDGKEIEEMCSTKAAKPGKDAAMMKKIMKGKKG